MIAVATCVIIGYKGFEPYANDLLVSLKADFSLGLPKCLSGGVSTPDFAASLLP